MKRAPLVACAVAAGAALGVAAPASATTFCVPAFSAGTCPNNGTNVQQADLEVAMGTQASDGTPDTVILTANVTSPDSIVVPTFASDALTVRGAGPAATTITSSSNGNIIVLDLWGAGSNSRVITLEDLKVAVPASMSDGGGAAVQAAGDTLDNVDVVSRNPQGAAPAGSGGVNFVGGGTFRDGFIGEEAGGAMDTAFGGFSSSGTMLIQNSAITGATNAVFAVTPTTTLVAQGVAVNSPGQLAFNGAAGTLVVQNSTVRTTTTSAISGSVVASSANDAVVIADHVTASESGAGSIAAVAANTNASSSGDVDVTVTNSIFRGFDAGHQRIEHPTSTGDSDLTIRHSNLPANGSELSTNSGVLTLANNIDQDPLFAGANDFHLTAESPSIDAGDPAPGGLTSDFDGLIRPQDGDDNGSVIRDQGAFEFPDPTPPVDQPVDPPADLQPPETSIDSGPGKKKQLRKRRATFTFSATEAGSTFECRLDRAGFMPCSSPISFKRLKRGKHTFSVRASDAAGNVDASPATKAFKVKKKKRKR